MKVVLSRPECNHIAYHRDKPDKAIMKIMDSYRCSPEPQGGWWLLEGPDKDNSCLLSWVLMDPSECTDYLLHINIASRQGFT